MEDKYWKSADGRRSSVSIRVPWLITTLKRDRAPIRRARFRRSPAVAAGVLACRRAGASRPAEEGYEVGEGALLAAPPANDDFADAIDLGSQVPATSSSTNAEATQETGERKPSFGQADGKSVWWKC